jgi:hypothetical protein
MHRLCDDAGRGLGTTGTVLNKSTAMNLLELLEAPDRSSWVPNRKPVSDTGFRQGWKCNDFVATSPG